MHQPKRAPRATPRTSFDSKGVRKWLSMTMRTSGADRKPSIRQVSSGSSASTVPTPTITASCRPRIAWAARRASAPVSHWLCRVLVAILPSSVEAVFQP